MFGKSQNILIVFHFQNFLGKNESKSFKKTIEKAYFSKNKTEMTSIHDREI